MTYEVRIDTAAARQIRKLPPDIQRRLTTAIGALASDPRPHGCTKLTGRDAWRIRVGDYRIIYEINDRQLQVMVVRAAHRREVY